MATMMDFGNLWCDSTTTPNFQAWVTWFESALTGIGGWTVTSDTGQTPPSSLVAPTVSLQKKGYRIYKMNDSFSITQPIYMRIDYGAGNSSGGFFIPGAWASIGKGTDGAGNLTGILWDGILPGNPPQANITNNIANQGPAAKNMNSYASGDNSRIVIAMWCSGLYVMPFSLERSRDLAGNYTSDGLLLSYFNPQMAGGGGTIVGMFAGRYLICAGGAQPKEEGGFGFAISRLTPQDTFGGPVGIAVPFHFKGVAQPPGTNWLIIGESDMAPEAQFQTTLYGQVRTYQHARSLITGHNMGVTPGQLPQSLNDYGMRVCIRYD
jgi:hypothetical protein